VEILALARENGYRVAEVPIRWFNDSASKVHPLRDSLKMLIDLVIIRLSLAMLHTEKERLDSGNVQIEQKDFDV